jgi:hypothetical protein
LEAATSGFGLGAGGGAEALTTGGAEGSTSSGALIGGGGVDVNIANCSGSGVEMGGTLGFAFGVSKGLALGAGVNAGVGFDSGATLGCVSGCGFEPSVGRENCCVSRLTTGRSLPSWVGNGASPVAGSLLAAMELAFDSKV